MLADLGQEGSDINLLGFGETELQQLLDCLQQEAALSDPDDVPPLPAEPVTKPGDLWLLDDHKVLCGDATKADDLARLLAGESASCLWTDPPYGVSYTGGTKDQLTIQNDDAAGLDDLLARSFAAIDPVLADGAAIYVAHPAGALSVTFGTCFLAKGQTRSGRVVAHSLLGCAFYGAFAAKVTIVRLHRFPRWVLPTAGGLLFAAFARRLVHERALALPDDRGGHLTRRRATGVVPHRSRTIHDQAEN